MPTFNLTSGATTYTLDTNGTFSAAGGTAGNWTVHDSGDLLLQAAGAADVRVPVEWRFTTDNQLAVQQDGKPLYNFHAAGQQPFLRLVNNVLQVRPALAVAFEFAVPFAWTLEPDLGLTAKLGAATSKIDGYSDDKKGRMVYQFSDKLQPSNQYLMVFSGEWSRSADPAHTTEIRLVFTYQQRGTTATFVLPATADVKNNHLVFSYAKNGTSRSVELMGSITLSKNFDVTFTIAQQTTSTGGVVTKETAITVSTAFEMNNLSGGLELTLVNSKQKIAITGAFNASLGEGGKLGIDFAYAKDSTATTKQKFSIAVDGTFSTKDGTTLTFTYKSLPDGGKTIALSGAGQFGQVGVSGGVQVAMPDGTSRQVTGFLQLSW